MHRAVNAYLHRDCYNTNHPETESMAGDLDANEWLERFESLRPDTKVNIEPPEGQRVRLSPDILQYIETLGEVYMSSWSFLNFANLYASSHPKVC